jgi:hypothetical protein
MKQYNWIIAAALLLLSACQTSANGSLQWAEDGVVTGAGGKRLQLDIQGIYDGLSYAGNNYLVGFKIDKEGNNYPHIVQMRDDLSSVKYWPFDNIPNDIFVYHEKVHVTTTDGNVYSLQDEKWELIDKKFPRESQVVYSDSKKDLVVCYPAAMEKTGDHNSGCISTNNKWQLDFVWFTIVPKTCDGKLHIVEENGNSKLFKQIDLATGKTLKSKPVKNVPEDICKLQ